MKKYTMYLAGGAALVILLALVLLWMPKGAADVEEKKEVVLTMMLPQTHYKNFFIRLIETFETENPDIRIEPQVIPDNSWTDIVKTKVLVRETPDIIRIDKALLMDVGAEHFIEMTADVPWYDRALPEQRESKLVDGRLYGLPVESGSEFGVVYNRSMFETYHLQVPENMEEFRQVCRALKEEGILPLYVSDKDAWTVQVPFNAVAPQVAPDEVWEQLKTGKRKWSEIPEFEAILQEMKALREEGYTNPDYVDATYTGALDALANEKAAMYIMGGFMIQDVQTLNPDIDLMLFPVPYGKDVLTLLKGEGQFSVFRDSRHAKEAGIFLEWLSRPENMDRFTEGWNYRPGFSGQDPELSEYQQFLLDTYITPERTVFSVQDQVEGIDWSSFWSLQQQMYAGAISPGEALERWDASFEEQMERGGIIP